MRKSVLLTVLAVSLVIVASIIGACSQGETNTQTVTSTQYQTATVVSTITVTSTVTRTQIGTEPPITAIPPQTPHSLALDYGQCFSCHLVPLGHEGRRAMESVCGECHVEAPIDEWSFALGVTG